MLCDVFLCIIYAYVAVCILQAYRNPIPTVLGYNPISCLLLP